MKTILTCLGSLSEQWGAAARDSRFRACYRLARAQTRSEKESTPGATTLRAVPSTTSDEV